MKGYPPGPGGANNYNGPPASTASFNGPSGMPPPVTSSGGYGGYPNSATGAGGPNMPPHQPYMNSTYPPGGQSGGPPSGPPTSASPAASSAGANSSAAPTPTGPDGVPIHDETSQQSTLSQSSDRSDGDRQTPKTNSSGPPNYGMQGGYPHPGTYCGLIVDLLLQQFLFSTGAPGSPHNNIPSPGAGMGGGGGHENSYGGWQQQGRPGPPGPPISQVNLRTIAVIA